MAVNDRAVLAGKYLRIEAKLLNFEVFRKRQKMEESTKWRW